MTKKHGFALTVIERTVLTMRLIDADALYEEHTRLAYEGDYAFHITARAWLEKQPTIDAVPVRHGANIGEDYAECDQFVCDQCGIELQGWYRVERDMDDGEEINHEYTFHYCPNCGAKMDGGEDA